MAILCVCVCVCVCVGLEVHYWSPPPPNCREHLSLPQLSNVINSEWISEEKIDDNHITTGNLFQLVKLYTNSLHFDYAEAPCMWYKAIMTEAINSTDLFSNTCSTGGSITSFFPPEHNKEQFPYY